MGKLSEYIQEQAKKKNKTPEVWLEGVLANLSKCTLATHVGKFSNPDSKVVIYDNSQSGMDGLVTTTSSACETDMIYSSAAYMASTKLLLQPMEDGKSCLEHLQAGESDVYEEFGQFGIKKERLHEALDGIKKAESLETDGRLRQVYFPVGEHDYHLLTVLPASSLMETMSSRIKVMNHRWFDTNDRKKDVYGESASHINDLTVIGFGGTKPQNISTLNANSGGKAYLLYSMPPIISDKHTRLPRHDVFMECIPYGICNDVVKKLHKLFTTDRNNMDIRAKIRSCIENVADYCIETAEVIRMQQEGWSFEEKYGNLSLAQKIWLDGAYEKEWGNDEWRHEVGKQFGKWIIRLYGRIEGSEKIALGDEEMQMFSEVMEDALRKEVNPAL